MWKRSGKNTALLFSLKRLEILHQERRGQVGPIVMGHFDSILFQKSEPPKKQPINQSINQSFRFKYNFTIHSTSRRREGLQSFIANILLNLN